MSTSFDAFEAAAIAKALDQLPDEAGRAPIALVTRHSVSLGAVAIPVFGNYHSPEGDLALARSVLAKWLEKYEWTVPAQAKDQLPVLRQVQAVAVGGVTMATTAQAPVSYWLVTGRSERQLANPEQASTAAQSVIDSLCEPPSAAPAP